jgi:cytochrome c5
MWIIDRSLEAIQNPTMAMSLEDLERTIPPTDFDAARKLAEQRQAQLLTTASDKEQRLRQALDKYKELCVICHAKGVQAYPKHTITQCPTMKSSGGLSTFYDHYKIRYMAARDGSPLRICFFCHVPQYSDLLHPFSSKKQLRSDCEHYDTILPVCYLTMEVQSSRQKAQDYFGREWDDRAAFRAWLENRDPGQVHNGCSTNGEAVFLWYCELEGED